MRELTREDLVRVLDMIRDEALRAFDGGARPRILGQNHVEEVDVPGIGVQRFITGSGAYLVDLSGKGEWKVPESIKHEMLATLRRIEATLLDQQAINRAMASPLARTRGGLRRAT